MINGVLTMLGCKVKRYANVPAAPIPMAVLIAPLPTMPVSKAPLFALAGQGLGVAPDDLATRALAGFGERTTRALAKPAASIERIPAPFRVSGRIEEKQRST